VTNDSSIEAHVTSPTPDVGVQQVSVTYSTAGRELRALDRVDLAPAQNEFVCLVGPSGCGKTTPLKVVAGIVSPTQGRAMVGDRTTTRPGPDRAVVFQEDVRFPWITVRDNVAHRQRVRGKSHDLQLLVVSGVDRDSRFLRGVGGRLVERIRRLGPGRSAGDAAGRSLGRS
jgi:ABC-type taurine transport system ATPase subunit